MGIFGHHKLIISICRTTFVQGKGKKLFYRCYKNFDSKLFEENLIKNWSEALHKIIIEAINTIQNYQYKNMMRTPSLNI